MALKDVKKVAGDTLPIVNHPVDAPSVFADGFAATIADESTFKLCLYEKIPHEGSMVGRFVMNVTFSRSGIKQVQEQLNFILGQIENDEGQE